MFRDKTTPPREVGRLQKRIVRLKALAGKYKRAEITQNVLLDISNMAASANSPEDFYAAVHRSINKLIPADNFFIATLDLTTDKINIPFFADEKDSHPQDLYPEEELSDTLYSGLTGYVLKTSQALLCDDSKYRQLIAAKRIVSRGSDCHQWLGVPIKNGAITSGVLVVQSYNRDINYGEMEAELMQFISHHISGVVERLQYQEQLEQAIEQRTKELSIAYDKLQLEVYERRRAERLQKSLFEIADLATSNIENEQFYAELHRVISHLLPVNNFFISLMNEDCASLSFPFYVSQLQAPAPQPRAIRDGLTEYILRNKKPRLLDKAEINGLIYSGELYSQAPELNNIHDIHQWIGVPLFIHGEARGTLTTYSYSFSQNYQEKDLDLLTFVSQHIATAIEKKLSAESMRLSYEQLEEKVVQRTQALASVNENLEEEIFQRKRIERQLVHDAQHDNLTNLPNRSMFMEQLSQAIKHIRRHSLDRFALLFIDMDRFKLLNDTLGHLEGDRFLIETSKRLKLCIRGNDTLGRLGGDEFVILLDSINTQQDAEEVAERVLSELFRPYQLANRQFKSSASIGIALSGNHNSDTSESMLRNADAAMYQAKSRGKGCYVVYDNHSVQQQVKDIELDNELKKAIQEKQLQLSYLPIMDLKSQKLLALEPRLFWLHPTQGKIKQAQLNNIAEHCNMLTELDKYTVKQLNLDYPQLQKQLGFAIKLQLSISSQHLKHKHAVRSLKNALKRCSFNLSKLSLFFNEKAFVQDTDSHISAFDSLKQLDVQLGISAYGSAHSAISSLTFLPIQVLKLDPSYATHLESSQHLKLVKAYFLAAQALELTVLATGVSTAEQKQKLMDIGFTTGQGLSLGKVLVLQSEAEQDCA